MGGKKRRPHSGLRRWDALPWKIVDTEGENITNLDDAMFFGLEELDGSAFVSTITNDSTIEEGETTNVTNSAIGEEFPNGKSSGTKKKKNKATISSSGGSSNDDLQELSVDVVTSELLAPSTALSTELKKRKKENSKEDNKASKKKKKSITDSVVGTHKDSKPLPGHIEESDSWGPLSLNAALIGSLKNDMSFQWPTNIQSYSIPQILRGGCDVVGVSETGSGKTLAFGIPIIHSLFSEWSVYGNTRSPYALILAPTRELAMQITSVMSDVCKAFIGTSRRVEVVNVVGGMSEHKQRRQLDDSKGRGRPVHVMVGYILIHIHYTFI